MKERKRRLRDSRRKIMRKKLWMYKKTNKTWGRKWHGRKETETVNGRKKNIGAIFPQTNPRRPKDLLLQGVLLWRWWSSCSSSSYLIFRAASVPVTPADTRWRRRRRAGSAKQCQKSKSVCRVSRMGSRFSGEEVKSSSPKYGRWKNSDCIYEFKENGFKRRVSTPRPLDIDLSFDHSFTLSSTEAVLSIIFIFIYFLPSAASLLEKYSSK